MPRAGLTTSVVVAAGAELADEIGIESVSLAALAARLGVKAPALYKHVDSLADLHHKIATMAINEFTDALRDALQGKSGADAISALFRTLQAFMAEYPGRYAATTEAKLEGPDDPLLAASTRFIESVRAVLFSYGIALDEVDHAIRMLRCTIHGYALLQAAGAFQWSNDPDESIAWMIRFVDAGLSVMGEKDADER